MRQRGARKMQSEPEIPHICSSSPSPSPHAASLNFRPAYFGFKIHLPTTKILQSSLKQLLQKEQDPLLLPYDTVALLQASHHAFLLPTVRPPLHSASFYASFPLSDRLVHRTIPSRSCNEANVLSSSRDSTASRIYLYCTYVYRPARHTLSQ